MLLSQVHHVHNVGTVASGIVLNGTLSVFILLLVLRPWLYARLVSVLAYHSCGGRIATLGTTL